MGRKKHLAKLHKAAFKGSVDKVSQVCAHLWLTSDTRSLPMHLCSTVDECAQLRSALLMYLRMYRSC